MRSIAECGVAALAGGLLLVAVARGQQGAPADAQIEASVLQALAGASDLANQNIQSSTVYGVVTLSGNVHSEGQRSEAENLTSRAPGVKKVVDELTLGDAPPPQDAQAQPANGNPAMETPPPGWVLQSDGTYAPPAGDSGQQTASSQPTGGQPPAQPGYAQAPPQGAPQQQGYPQGGYPPQQGYPQRQAMGPNGGYPAYMPPPGVARGQRGGMTVTVPDGSTLQVRLNRGIDSNHIAPGTPFDGIVMNDVVAGGAVAIPRGSQVSGVVVDSKRAGALKGRGELALQINGLTLGGQVYPLQSNVWERNGRDKTAGTVDRAVGLGALGAIVGAVAGGGAGAAIGAGVGAGAGVASSAASPGGRVIIPPESVVTFSVAQPLGVRTVSEREMARLAVAAGPPPQPARPAMRRYCSPYYGCYWGPAGGPPPPPPGY